MSKGNRTVCHYRTIWVSDVHLGSEGCKARALTDFLKRHDCDRLYLVGDIFDGWKLRTKFYWTPDHSRVIKTVISKARHGTKVYYIAGNHDDFMRQFVRKQLRLGKVRLANEVVHTTADGRRLLVIHGDQFDVVMEDYRWLAYAGDFGYELLMRSNTWVNRVRGYLGLPYWSLSAYAKNKVKASVQYLSGFDNKVLHRCRQSGLNGIICGHTHHSEIRYISHGVTSYNCGDWVESCTALAEDFEGNIELLHLPDMPERAPATRSAAPPPTPAESLSEALPAMAELAELAGAITPVTTPVTEPARKKKRGSGGRIVRGTGVERRRRRPRAQPTESKAASAD